MQKDPRSPGKNNKQGKENSQSPNIKRTLDSEGSPQTRRNKHKIGLKTPRALDLQSTEPLASKPIVPQGDFRLASTLYQRPQPAAPQVINQDIDMTDIENLLALGESDDHTPLLQDQDIAPMEVDHTAEEVAEAPEENHLQQQPAAVANIVEAQPVVVENVAEMLAVVPAHPANNLPMQAQPAAVAANAAEVLHLTTYRNRETASPKFLNAGTKQDNKKIFELLHAKGCRFLCGDARHVRYWGNYPSHEKTFIVPLTEHSRQFHLSAGPNDIIYKGTWVSAVVKDINNQFYPVHIVTKNTLGAVRNIIGYRNRIERLFSQDEFPIRWPHGLGEECLIVCVDTPEQKQQAMKDYETCVTSEGAKALQTVPNFRVFCKGQLSELMTVQTCKQPTLYNFLKPDLRPFTNRQFELLQIEMREVDARRGQIAQDVFQNVCAQFYSPAPLSHELALTHFSLTELQHFCGVVTQSRNRMVDLKGRLYAKFQGPQMKDADLQRFVAMISRSINERTAIINKLNDLATRYTAYSTSLSNLFNVALSPNMEDVERVIYGNIQDLMQMHHHDHVTIEAQFISGRALISWMLAHNINIPANKNVITLVDEIAEHMPRAEANLLRAF